MCKVCELKEGMGKAFIEMLNDVSSLGDIAIDAVGLLHKLKTRGVEFDSDEDSLYTRLLGAVAGDGPATGAATDDDTGQALPEDIKRRIAEAVATQTGIDPANIIFCDSPEQAEAMIEKLANEDAKKKPN